MDYIIELNEKAIAFVLPENTTVFRVVKNQLALENSVNKLIHYKPLPDPGPWTAVGRPKDLTGGEILGLVEKENDGSGDINCWWYKNYLTGTSTKDFRESFVSLLRSKKADPANIIVLTKDVQA